MESRKKTEKTQTGSQDKKTEDHPVHPVILSRFWFWFFIGLNWLMGILCFVLALGIAGVQDDPRDLYKRGLTFYNGGQYEEALELLKRASALQEVSRFRSPSGRPRMSKASPRKPRRLFCRYWGSSHRTRRRGSASGP